MKAPLVPISWGELFDKISILKIKAAKLPGASARQNVEKELSLLSAWVTADLASSARLADLTRELRTVNIQLWEVEDMLRETERRGEFGDQFVEAARSVYILNDQRARVKRTINDLLGSEIVEEKSYVHNAAGITSVRKSGNTSGRTTSVR